MTTFHSRQLELTSSRNKFATILSHNSQEAPTSYNMAACHIPEDVLHSICTQLRLTGLWNDHNDDKLKMNTLKSMALASQACHRASLTSMFHTIIINDHVTAKRRHQLLNQLLRSSTKANLVRKLLVLAVRHSEDISYDEMPIIENIWHNLHTWKRKFVVPQRVWLWIEDGMRRHDCTVEVLLLVSLCTRAERVVLDEHFPDADGFTYFLVRGLQPLFSNFGALMKSLERDALTLKEDAMRTSSLNQEQNDFDNPIALHPPPHLSRILGLQELTVHEFYLADIRDDFVGLNQTICHWVRQGPDTLLQQIKHVRLEDCIIDAEILYEFVEAFRSLESLVIAGPQTLIERHDWDTTVGNDGIIGKGLQTVSINLKKFVLNLNMTCVQGELPSRSLLGDVRALAQLEHLVVSIGSLRVPRNRRQLGEMQPLITTLPPSVRSLVILDNDPPPYHEQFDEIKKELGYNKDLLQQFISEVLKLMEDCAFCNLEEVTVVLDDLCFGDLPRIPNGWSWNRVRYNSRSLEGIEHDSDPWIGDPEDLSGVSMKRLPVYAS